MKVPGELFKEWECEWWEEVEPGGECDGYEFFANKAAEWAYKKGADDELEACCQLLYDRFSSVTDGPNPVALELKEWLFASRRKTNNLLTITVNDIPLKITAEQESQINKILNIQNATD